MFRIEPHIHQRLSEASKKPLCAPGPRDPTETESDLPLCVCLFWVFQRSGIMQFVVSCDWPLALSVLFSKFICVAACVSAGRPWRCCKFGSRPRAIRRISHQRVT